MFLFWSCQHILPSEWRPVSHIPLLTLFRSDYNFGSHFHLSHKGSGSFDGLIRVIKRKVMCSSDAAWIISLAGAAVIASQNAFINKDDLSNGPSLLAEDQSSKWLGSYLLYLQTCLPSITALPRALDPLFHYANHTLCPAGFYVYYLMRNFHHLDSLGFTFPSDWHHLQLNIMF